jgi:hypothetical protein
VAFTNALLALKVAPSKIADAATEVANAGGTPNRYDDYVWMHSTVGMGAHFGSAFGAWHREFLRQLEYDLRLVSGDPDIVIPYWDWTTGRVPGDPNWPFTDDLMGPLGDAAGIVTSGPFSSSTTWRINIRRMVVRDDGLAQVPDGNVRLRRRPATAPTFNLPSGPTARAGMASAAPYDAAPFNEFPLFQAQIDAGATNAQLNALLNTWTTASFRKYLEWFLHNGPHTWVGGQDDWSTGAAPVFIAGPMSIPAVSPNDPVFWLHHCNVDRLWTAWQQRHPPGAYAPAAGADAGHNLNDQMVHFQASNAGNFNTSLRGTPADVVDSRGALDIWYTSDLPVITLVTPSVDFGDVPANLTTDWPVKFDVRTCRPVKFRVTAVGGANFRVPPSQGDVVADHDHHHDPVRANVFLEFQALGAANVVQPGSATIGAFIDDTEGYFTGTVGAELQIGTYPVTMSARPVPAPQAAVTFVLDRSGSMSDSAGPAGTKYDLLRSSLRVVAGLMRDGDAVGLVSYDDVVATLTPAMSPMGTVSPPGAGRQAVENAITSGALTPRNMTAIGAGMIAGAAVLQTVQSDPAYPTKAMVVMTDGNENVAPSVTDASVASAIAWFNDSVYAIGLGDETNVSAATLGAVARYQLITGNITTSEQQFLLTKYFLQILAAISDNAVVVDPQGELRPGDVHRIGFDIGESDVSMDVVAICPLAPLLDFSLEAPDGTVVRAGTSPNVALQVDAGDEFYRIGLPAVPGSAAGTHAGRWTAVLRLGDPRKLGAAREGGADIDRQALASVGRRGALAYQLFVQSYSNLSMKVDLAQDGFAPGTTLRLSADLLEYRQPLAGPARVIVEVAEPGGFETSLQLGQVGPGRFRGEYVASRRGVYTCRFRASGTTRGGRTFQREETRSAAVNARLGPGGGLATTVPPSTSGPDRRHWCELLACLLKEPSIARLLARYKIEAAEIERCLKRYCAPEREAPAAPPVRAAKKPAARELDKLREEVRTLESVLLRPPEAKPLPPPPKPKAADPAHEAHHFRALPAVVVDDDGTTRVFVPSREPHPTGPGGHDHHDEPDDHHDDDTHGGHAPGGHDHPHSPGGHG